MLYFFQFRQRRRRKSQVLRRITTDGEFLTQIQELKEGLGKLQNKMDTIKAIRRSKNRNPSKTRIVSPKEKDDRIDEISDLLICCSLDGIVFIIISILLDFVLRMIL